MAAPLGAQSAPARYEAAMARETQVRAEGGTVRVLRALVAQYEDIFEKYPKSGYSDNALWQGAGVAMLAFERYGQDADRRTALRLLQLLQEHYPGGTLARQVPARIAEIPAPSSVRRTSAVPGAPAASATPPPVSADAPAPIRLTEIVRSALPNGERLTISMESEPQYHEERIANPERLFFDFRNTAAGESARPTLAQLAGGVIRDVRLGPRPERTTRLVVELEPNTRHSVFALYNPYRLVIDLERGAASPSTPVQPPAPPVTEVKTAGPSAPPPPVLSPRPAPMRDAGPPVLPSANSNGTFSLARQLGLGVARIVIDPGHGGHDPGAIANKAFEAELVLDIALRLEKLLLKHQGIQVVLTRRTDVFVPLEERTAIANREDADLFLSIHANVGGNANANGIETYFLNFATNPEAEAVAARENSGAGMSMHNLTDIVRKIALNNKLDESRDFAQIVQTSLYRGIRQHNAQARNRGVKQAPFVVLIGAQMPSVLAEVSFVTNKKEASLLKTAAYRQRVAQSLFDAVLRYRQSLKKVGTVASGTESR